MAYKLDDTDRAIIDLLLKDGRMSSADIARRLEHTTERTVRNRLERLIAEGVIRVSAIVNPRALGYTVTADVFIEVEPGRIMAVAQKMTGFNCVTYVACSTGDRDVSVQIVARSNEELYRFVTEVIANVPGVRRTTTVLLPLVLKDVYQRAVPEEP